MKTLGLIGGTSWHLTIEYRLINELVGAKIGTQGNPPLIIHSINIEIMHEQDKAKINAKYLDVAAKLQQAGAEAIVICANTPHMVYSYVQSKIDIPILHIAEATGKEAARNKLKTLGLLGNRPTMTGNLSSPFWKISLRLKQSFQMRNTWIKPIILFQKSSPREFSQKRQGSFSLTKCI